MDNPTYTESEARRQMGDIARRSNSRCRALQVVNNQGLKNIVPGFYTSNNVLCNSCQCIMQRQDTCWLLAVVNLCIRVPLLFRSLHKDLQIMMQDMYICDGEGVNILGKGYESTPQKPVLPSEMLSDDFFRGLQVAGENSGANTLSFFYSVLKFSGFIREEGLFFLLSRGETLKDDQCVLIDCKEKELPGEQSVQQFLKVVLKQCYTHTMQAGLLSMENATTGSRHAVSFTVCTNDSGGKNLNVCDWGNCNTLMTMVQSTAITADIESDYDFVYCDFPDCCTTWLCPPEKKLKFCKILMLKIRNLRTH